jgi:hypothetical protein
MRQAGRQAGWHVAIMEDIRNAYKILVRIPGGKRSLIRPRQRCKDNI